MNYAVGDMLKSENVYTSDPNYYVVLDISKIDCTHYIKLFDINNEVYEYTYANSMFMSRVSKV